MTRSSLPQNYLVDTPIDEDFSNRLDWTYGGTGTKIDDTTTYRTGTQSIRFTVAAGQTNASILKLTNLPMSKRHTVELWFYVHDLSVQGQIVLYLGSVSNLSKEMHATFAAADMVAGWNQWELDSYDWTFTGGEVHEGPKVRIKLAVYAKAGSGGAPSVSFDSLSVRKTRRPRLMITFDDMGITRYSEGYRVMHAAGLRGTIYAIPSEVGGYNQLSLANMQEMYAAGWAFGNHTHNHKVLTSLSQAEAEEEIASCSEWLVTNGFPRAAYHGAYPTGAHNATVHAAVIAAGMQTFRTTVGNHIFAPNYTYYTLPSSIYVENMTLSDVEVAIEDAIWQGGSAILTFHNLLESPTEIYDWSIADFESLIQWIVDKGYSKYFCTIDEWYIGLTNPRYQSLPVGRT